MIVIVSGNILNAFLAFQDSNHEKREIVVAGDERRQNCEDGRSENAEAENPFASVLRRHVTARELEANVTPVEAAEDQRLGVVAPDERAVL